MNNPKIEYEEKFKLNTLNFMGDIANILEETNTHQKQQQDYIKAVFDLLEEKPRDIVREETKVESYTIIRKTNVISASHFSYINALFERYLKELLKFIILTNNDAENRYLDKFESVGMTPDYSYLVKHTRTLEQRLEKIDDVSIASQGYINLYKVILDIKDKNDKFDKEYVNYIEIRERYNLIKHRGDIFDNMYVSRITRNLKKFSQKYDANEIFNKFIKDIRGDTPDSLIGQTVSFNPRYIRQTVYSITYLSAYLIYKSQIDKEVVTSLLNSTVHSFLCLNHSIKSYNIYILISDICSLFGPFNKRPTLLQFNTILNLKRHQNFLNDFKPKKINLDEFNKKIMITLESLLSKTTLEENYKELIKLYVNNLNNELIDFTCSIDLDKSSLETWSIFQDFHNDEYFLTQFKKKFESEFIPKITYY